MLHLKLRDEKAAAMSEQNGKVANVVTQRNFFLDIANRDDH